MDLKHKVVSRFEVDFVDLESFIQDKLGFHYEIQCSEEMGNDTQRSIGVDGIIDEWGERKLTSLKGGKMEYFALTSIMNKLCLDGYILKGDYLIRICW